ncbi:MAG TPA: zf-HC2 domain-containing protein [Actinomycetota bacterium]|nr:zf-HC2 domain-containing protein [Actinomycetota bacterium]
MKKHDPETSAAAYLAGVTSRRARRRFEAHILECEECWGEVRLGRSGRQLAETARELAPQPLRERVRAAVSLLPKPRVPWQRRLRLVTIVVFGAFVAVFATQLVLPQQPELIQTLISHFEEQEPPGRPVSPAFPERLGDLRLLSARSLQVEGVSIGAHRYRDPAGHELVVYRAARSFPMATGARTRGTGWEASDDGTVLLCTDRPAPSLIAGDDGAEVRLAARLLGLA